MTLAAPFLATAQDAKRDFAKAAALERDLKHRVDQLLREHQSLTDGYVACLKRVSVRDDCDPLIPPQLRKSRELGEARSQLHRAQARTDAVLNGARLRLPEFFDSRAFRLCVSTTPHEECVIRFIEHLEESSR
jgi:hypothetical protein